MIESDDKVTDTNRIFDINQNTWVSVSVNECPVSAQGLTDWQKIEDSVRNHGDYLALM